MSAVRNARCNGVTSHAPVDFITAEPDQISDDEAVHALLHVLEQVTSILVVVAEGEAHITRCAGCGSWAWDEHPCSTCTLAAGYRRSARLRATVRPHQGVMPCTPPDMTPARHRAEALPQG